MAATTATVYGPSTRESFAIRLPFHAPCLPLTARLFEQLPIRPVEPHAESEKPHR